MQACPIPEVDRVLSSYVHDRQEALKIRSVLAKHFYANFRLSQVPIQDQHLHHLCPQDVTRIPSDLGIPEGLRQGYLRALQKKRRAQEKQREQYALLENLRHNDSLETSVQAESTYDVDTVRDYVALLRQRRRFAELQVIHESLEKIMDSDPTIHHLEPRTMVQKAIGDQPGLPAEQLERPSQAQNENSWIHKLKKEVLLTRSSMDQANSEKINAKEKYGHINTLANQVYALGSARDVIVSWVEEELLKLNEESEFLEDMSPIKIDPSHIDNAESSPSETRIRQAYTQYTTSRTRIVEDHGVLSSDYTPTPLDEDPKMSPHQDSQPSRQNKPFTDILPHIPRLFQISDEERRILQHSVYMQTKLSSTDGELREALSKLSEESHLLPSGSQGLSAWAKAALNAEKGTGDTVNAQLRQSFEHIASLNSVVDTASLRMKLLALTQSRM